MDQNYMAQEDYQRIFFKQLVHISDNGSVLEDLNDEDQEGSEDVHL